MQNKPKRKKTAKSKSKNTTKAKASFSNPARAKKAYLRRGRRLSAGFGGAASETWKRTKSQKPNGRIAVKNPKCNIFSFCRVRPFLGETEVYADGMNENESVYLRQSKELASKAGEKTRNKLQQNGHKTKKEAISDVKKRFLEFRDSEQFKSAGVKRPDQATFKISNALNFLEEALSGAGGTGVKREIYRRYRLNNRFLNADISYVKAKNSAADGKDVEVKTKQDADVNFFAPICQVALNSEQRIPSEVRGVVADCVTQGVKKLREKAKKGESVEFGEDLVTNSLEFRCLEAERRRLERTRMRELALLERKSPGVLKEDEKQRRQPKEGGWRVKSLWGANKKPRQLLDCERYRMSSEGLEYRGICLFYAERFEKLDQRFDDLLRKRIGKIQDDEYMGLSDSLIYKNTVLNAVLPETRRQMEALQSTVFEEPDGNDGAVLGKLKSFSEEALGIILA